MMARCAPEDRFFGLIKVLFRTQGSWARSSDPVAELAKIGRLAGVDEATFTACMDSEPLVDGLIRLREEGAAEGVASTPTFVINGERVVGGKNVDELAEIIDPLIGN
jgi:protein-disulfide isomerase